METWSFGYDKSKKKAKQIYSKIGRIQCPALNDEYVAFTSEGFNHLLRKGRIPRTRNEQKRRFVLLVYAEQIIKNSKSFIFYERREARVVANRHGEKVTIKSIADFWTLTEKIDGCNIKLIIRQLQPHGQKHFMSIMGDKVRVNRRAKTKKSRL